MKKMNKIVKNNDRITITKEPGYIHFYYQAAGQASKEYLYSMEFSGSVFAYFRNNGITIREMYEFNDWHNPKLAKVMDRLPKIINSLFTEKDSIYTYTQKKEEMER